MSRLPQRDLITILFIIYEQLFDSKTQDFKLREDNSTVIETSVLLTVIKHSRDCD